MATTIAPWGNSEAVRIPRDVLRSAGLRRGDQVSFEVNRKGRIEIIPQKQPHRRVEPARGVTFDTLFKGYEGGCLANGDAWPSDDLAGADWDSWAR